MCFELYLLCCCWDGMKPKIMFSLSVCVYIYIHIFGGRVNEIVVGGYQERDLRTGQENHAPRAQTNDFFLFRL